VDPATIFFLHAPSRSSSRATFLRARKVARDLQWTAAGGEGVSARYGVGRDRQRTAARGGPVLAMESLATTIGSGRRRVEGRGFLSRSMDHIWWEESPGRAGDLETRAIGLLPSRARLGIYAKFALSFVKLPKIQTLNAKLYWIPLFAIFGKLQEFRVQMQNSWRCSN
jgi:hypothetical protein